MKKEIEKPKKGRPKKVEIKPKKPAVVEKPAQAQTKEEILGSPMEEKLEFEKPPEAKKPEAEGFICQKCKGELKNKPKYCPTCGLELDWSGVP